VGEAGRSEPIAKIKDLGHDRASVIRAPAYPVATLRCVSDHPDPPAEPSTDPAVPSDGTGGDYMADDQYKEAVVDLLGALAYGELTAFERLADDATFAPTIADKAALARMAVAEYHHFELLRDRLDELGAAPELAMEPFTEALHSFHERTAPGDWLEGLVKAYVGDGIAEDFYREVSAYVDSSTRALVLRVLEDTGHSEFAVDRVRAAIADDPRRAGRLALWGRRLVGEALSQAQRVAAERDALSTLLVGGVDRPGADLAEVGRMFARLTENHTRRMAALGLSA
jgi:tRNA-(MS[2]IO[6]A)-hydroxylase (MiaE)-like